MKATLLIDRIRSAALVLHFDVAFIMLPVCRNFVSVLRRGPLNGIIPFEKNVRGAEMPQGGFS